MEKIMTQKNGTKKTTNSNPVAKDLRTRKYRKRVVEDKTKKIKRMKMFEILERLR